MKENHLHASSPELWKIANGMRKLTREGRILAPLFVCSFVCLFVCVFVCFLSAVLLLDGLYERPALYNNCAVKPN